MSGRVKQKARLSFSQEGSSQGRTVNLLLCDQAACSCVTCGTGQWSILGLPWGRGAHSHISWLLDCSQFPSGNHVLQGRKAGILTPGATQPSFACARSQEIGGGWGFTPALLLSAVACCKSVLWLVLSTTHSSSASSLCRPGELIVLTKEPQASANDSWQKGVLQALGLPIALRPL